MTMRPPLLFLSLLLLLLVVCYERIFSGSLIKRFCLRDVRWSLASRPMVLYGNGNGLYFSTTTMFTRSIYETDMLVNNTNVREFSPVKDRSCICDSFCFVDMQTTLFFSSLCELPEKEEEKRRREGEGEERKKEKGSRGSCVESWLKKHVLISFLR